MNKLLFSTFEVTRQAFYRTSLSYAIVNLKPVVPGHVLVVPNRVVPRLADLTAPEIADLFSSVQTVGKTVEKAYGADGLTIVCQDGKAAGQTVVHVHVHILPRKLASDFFEGRMDEVYPVLDESERGLGQTTRRTESTVSVPLKVDADEDRKPRTMDEMEKEAEWLKCQID